VSSRGDIARGSGVRRAASVPVGRPSCGDIARSFRSRVRLRFQLDVHRAAMWRGHSDPARAFGRRRGGWPVAVSASFLLCQW
jgi:hypothetical protein